MKKLYVILSVLMVFAMLFTACKDTTPPADEPMDEEPMEEVAEEETMEGSPLRG